MALVTNGGTENGDDGTGVGTSKRMMNAASSSKAAPIWTMPSTHIVTIEYPGFIHESAESLDRALTTLSPRSGPITDGCSASYALQHISSLLEKGGRILECHLLPWYGKEAADMYRHPILGDVVPGDSLVVRIHRRVWRNRKSDMYRKQYKLELIGACAKTVRFRRMADFAFRPDPPAGCEEHPTMALHRALMQLDVDAMRTYRYPPESETYEVPETTKDGSTRMRSNLAMLPPPFFSRQELPFPFGYRQNPTSSLQTLSHATTSKRSRRTARKGEADTEPKHGDDRGQTTITRYINRARWRNLAPIAIKFSDPAPVPTMPDASLATMPLSEKQKTQLAMLQEQWQKRPIWSRLALLNQFSEADARAIMQVKELFALVAYTFADGPWRDALVRFGYDPRTDRQSRFYQRIHMRGKAPRAPTTRGSLKAEYGDTATSARSSRGGGNVGFSSKRPPTHVFHGKTTTLHTSTFQLCDITVLSIVPLIHADGPSNLLLSPDVRS